LTVFLISFVIINWNNISWVFNYKFIAGYFSGLFQKANTVLSSNATSSPDKEIKNGSAVGEFIYKEDTLEIPKIEISVPLILADVPEAQLVNYLNKGVVLFPGSVLPGQAGQTIIEGHSAPTGWPKIKYDWVFSRLNDLTAGDQIFVYFKNREYIYSVTNKYFLDKGDKLPQALTNSNNVLVLISCWPPGKNIKRIAVVAEITK